VITHEEEVAAHAKRVVRMRDGLISSDERHGPVGAPPPRLAADRPVPEPGAVAAVTP
jgi:putative ABC transport system ATP-binding protein